MIIKMEVFPLENKKSDIHRDPKHGSKLDDRPAQTGLPGCAAGELELDRLKHSVAALGRRCLSLEQELIKKEQEAQREAQERLRTALHISVYYDTGNGYSEQQKVTQLVVCDGRGFTSFEIILPEDALELRLDPGDDACIIKKLAFSDPVIRAVPPDGYILNENSYIFSKPDPNIYLDGKNPFSAAEPIRISFEYERLKEGDVCDAIQTLRHRVAQLDQELSALYTSSSWRLTAPIRAIKQLLSRRT